MHLQTSILLPPYIYPTPHAWSPLYTALSLHPNLPITIIINPSNGPGPTPYPEPPYTCGLSQLNTFSNSNTNIHLLGYVHTNYGMRPQSEVEADVSRYAAWSSHSCSDISVGGIFFDESPSRDDGITLSYMTAVSTHARATFPSARRKIVFNPGVMPEAPFFSIADQIVVLEDSYSAFRIKMAGNVSSVVPDREERRKAIIMVYGFNGTEGELGELVEGVGRDVGGLFVTTGGDYDGWGRLWGSFGAAMAEADGG